MAPTPYNPLTGTDPTGKSVDVGVSEKSRTTPEALAAMFDVELLEMGIQARNAGDFFTLSSVIAEMNKRYRAAAKSPDVEPAPAQPTTPEADQCQALMGSPMKRCPEVAKFHFKGVYQCAKHHARLLACDPETLQRRLKWLLNQYTPKSPDVAAAPASPTTPEASALYRLLNYPKPGPDVGYWSDYSEELVNKMHSEILQLAVEVAVEHGAPKSPDVEPAPASLTTPEHPTPSIKIKFDQIGIDRISENQLRVYFNDDTGKTLTSKDWDMSVGDVLTLTDLEGSLRLNLVGG